MAEAAGYPEKVIPVRKRGSSVAMTEQNSSAGIEFSCPLNALDYLFAVHIEPRWWQFWEIAEIGKEITREKQFSSS